MVRTTFICGYKNKCLYCYQLVCQFSKVVVIRSPVFSTRHGFPPAEQVLSTSYTTLRVWCHADHCCGSQVSQLGRNIGFTLAQCLLVLWKLNLTEGTFKSVPSQKPLCLVSEVHGGLKPSTSGRQPEETVRTVKFWESLGHLHQQLKGGLFLSGIGIFVNQSLTLRGAFLAKMTNFH